MPDSTSVLPSKRLIKLITSVSLLRSGTYIPVYLQPQRQFSFFIIYLSRRRFISRLLRDAGWSHRGVDGWYKQENTSDVIAVHLPHFQLNRNHESHCLSFFYFFFLKNNTNNIKWKRLLKIITMLQVPRFDNLKEEKHIYTKVYIYILIFIFKGYGQEEQSGRRPLI